MILPVTVTYTYFDSIHIFYLPQEFQLIDKKELAPLQELIDRLTAASNPGDTSNPPSEH